MLSALIIGFRRFVRMLFLLDYVFFANCWDAGGFYAVDVDACLDFKNFYGCTRPEDVNILRVIDFSVLDMGASVFRTSSAIFAVSRS